MHRTTALTVAATAIGPLAAAAITIAAAAPAAAVSEMATAAPLNVISFLNEPVDDTGCVDATSTECNPGDPAGGTGMVAGPQSEPDVASGPGVDANAGSTGLDSGPALPPDVQTDPGLQDGGQPAGLG